MPSLQHLSRLVLVGASAAFAATAFILANSTSAAQQPPGGGAGHTTLDVAVVDAAGRPVADLRPGDFELTIDGDRRSVQSAVFISLAPTGDTAGPGPSGAYSANDWTPPGRLVALVVDQGHIRAGGSRAVSTAAAALLDRLNPADRVALLTIPAGGAAVPFTADRGRIHQALERLTGHAQPGRSSQNLGLAEALALEEGDSGRWDLVVQRECDDRIVDQVRRLQCHQMAEQTAREMIGSVKQSATLTLQRLEQVFAWLGPLQGPKTVVLVTEGLVTGTPRNPTLLVDARPLRSAAAAAQASLYVLHLQAPLFEMNEGRVASSGAEDEALHRQGLDAVVSQVRGALFPVVSGGDAAFARVATETSGYYLLAFEPRLGERDGKAHRVGVRVGRPGALVRARPDITLVAARGGAPSADERLLEILRSPVPARGIPLSVTTYVVRGADSRTRVILAAGLPGAAVTTRDVSVGYLVMGEGGQPAANTVAKPTLQVVGSGERARLQYTAAWEAPPGAYVLKFAALEGRTARSGAVEHRFTVPADSDATLTASDVLLFDGPVSPHPTPDGIVSGESLGLRLELYGRPSAQAGVRLEVRSSAAGPALVASAGVVAAGSDQTHTVVEGALAVSSLATGDYIARAVVARPDGEAIVRERPFRRVAPAAATVRGARGSGEPPVSSSAAAEAALANATEYVAAYVRMLSTVVCEERYDQRSERQTAAEWDVSQPGGLTVDKRSLVSDLVFVQLPDSGEWSTFRDVYSVDGQTVRDRQDRLLKLFIEPRGDRWEQVDRIREESSRHNLGGATRDINVPTFALQFLLPHVRSHFSFQRVGREEEGGVTTEVFKYEETARPTIIQGRNDEPVPASGRVWVTPADGVVVRITLETRSDRIRTRINTSFQRDERLGMWLPKAMEERHDLPGEVTTGRAVYTNFRQFKVETSEKIK